MSFIVISNVVSCTKVKQVNDFFYPQNFFKACIQNRRQKYISLFSPLRGRFHGSMWQMPSLMPSYVNEKTNCGGKNVPSLNLFFL